MLLSTYSYDSRGRPVVTAHIGTPTSIRPRWSRSLGYELRSSTALIDTGADFSGVTTQTAHMEELLVQSRRLVGGVHGQEVANAYIGDIGILLPDEGGENRLVLLEATILLEVRGGALGCDVLLGRDFLNCVTVTLDGAAQTFSIRANLPVTQQ